MGRFEGTRPSGSSVIGVVLQLLVAIAVIYLVITFVPSDWSPYLIFGVLVTGGVVVNARRLKADRSGWIEVTEQGYIRVSWSGELFRPEHAVIGTWVFGSAKGVYLDIGGARIGCFNHPFHAYRPTARTQRTVDLSLEPRQFDRLVRACGIGHRISDRPVIRLGSGLLWFPISLLMLSTVVIFVLTWLLVTQLAPVVPPWVIGLLGVVGTVIVVALAAAGDGPMLANWIGDRVVEPQVLELHDHEVRLLDQDGVVLAGVAWQAVRASALTIVYYEPRGAGAGVRRVTCPAVLVDLGAIQLKIAFFDRDFKWPSGRPTTTRRFLTGHRVSPEQGRKLVQVLADRRVMWAPGQ